MCVNTNTIYCNDLSGMLQALAGFFVYFVIMVEHGFYPQLLFGLQRQWDDKSLGDLQDSFGQEWVNYLLFKLLENCSHAECECKKSNLHYTHYSRY